MPAPRRHAYLDCGGELRRIITRRDRTHPESIADFCERCHATVLDEFRPMNASLTTLRFAAGDVTNAIRELTFSKYVHRKFAAVVRGNLKLRRNANPNLIHIRRDFGYAQ